MKSHQEHIECPGCKSEQSTTVEHALPWWSYVHTCTECNYIIMESEWNEIRTPQHMTQHPLIYGKEYDCYLNGKFIGTGTYTEDPNVGDSFLKAVISSTGELVNEVLMPDKWELK